MYEPEKAIEQNYDIKVSSYIPYRDGFILSTSTGKYFLKSINISEERLLFIDGLKKYIDKNGFCNIDRYLNTSDKSLCFYDQGSRYVVSEFITGRECDFYNKDDIINATRILANFHKKSRGYMYPENAYAQNFLGQTPKWYEKKISECNRIKNRAALRKTKFDSLLMEYIDYFITRCNNSLTELLKSGYGDLVAKARIELPVCHNDFSYYSVICSGENFYLINFDYCCYDLKIFDIANLILKRMRKCNWDIDETLRILDEYNKIYSISKDEIDILKIVINFPQKLCKTINRYYNSKKSKAKTGYLVKLRQLINELDSFETYIKQLRKL